MTPAEELKILVRKFPWALGELIYDQKMVEANRIHNLGINKAYAYLGIAEILTEAQAEELLYDVKGQEAAGIIHNGNNAMFQYLKERYGSGQEVLLMMRTIVKTSGPLKTAFLFGNDTRTQATNTKGRNSRSKFSQGHVSRHRS